MHQPLRQEVFIVDDDPAVRDALTVIFTVEGYRVTGFADGASFLAAARVRPPTCVLLDLRLPGRSGLDVLQELNAQGYAAPILIISGHGDIPMAVTAIKNGALDFIEKPFEAEQVVAHVRKAIAAWGRRENGNASAAPAPRVLALDALTPRERDVLAQIAGGASNKEAGRLLGISPRTIEVHRARIMAKLGAKNAADLVRIVLSDGRGV